MQVSTTITMTSKHEIGEYVFFIRHENVGNDKYLQIERLIMGKVTDIYINNNGEMMYDIDGFYLDDYSYIHTSIPEKSMESYNTPMFTKDELITLINRDPLQYKDK